ncbi:hypothetical protein Dimus_039380 [Dionaea muscipula]
MARMTVDDTRSLGYGALLTHIFTAMGVDLSHSLSIPAKAPITSYTIQRSNVADRMARAPERDDPCIQRSGRDLSDRPSRRSSTSAPSSSAPPAPAPGPFSRLPPEYQDAFTYLSDQMRAMQVHFDARMDAQFGTGSFAHLGVGTYTQFGSTPFGTSQFAAPQYGTPQYGAPQFGASQFSGGGFSQFGAGSSYVSSSAPPVPPVYPPPSYPPRIIPDYGVDDADDDEDDDDDEADD